MEHFFQFGSQEEDTIGFETSINQRLSAFVEYVDQPRAMQEFPRRIVGLSPASNNSRSNLNKRMLGFLKSTRITTFASTMTTTMAAEAMEHEKERTRRHMINERIRREKQKQNYLSLHSLLPPGTKNDKNSIIQVAAKEVDELRSLKEDFVRKNYELESALGGRRRYERPNEYQQDEENYCICSQHSQKVSKIKLSVAHPSSGIDSMLGVLKCLRETSSKPISISSCLSPQEFSAVLEVQTKIEAANVEEAIQRALIDIEKNLRTPFPEGSAF